MYVGMEAKRPNYRKCRSQDTLQKREVFLKSSVAGAVFLRFSKFLDHSLLHTTTKHITVMYNTFVKT
jgi:hypothetical protein